MKQINEKTLNRIIKESISNVISENENTDAMMSALEDLENAENYLENAQAMAYNFGMEEEADSLMGQFYALKQKISALLNGR